MFANSGQNGNLVSRPLCRHGPFDKMRAKKPILSNKIQEMQTLMIHGLHAIQRLNSSAGCGMWRSFNGILEPVQKFPFP